MSTALPSPTLGLRDHLGLAALAALTSWVALWSWAGFTERPSGFLVPALFGALLVAVTGVLLRAARLPALLALLGQAAVVGLWLNRSWAAELSLGGWLPTSASLTAVADRIGAGTEAAQLYAAPVPETAPEIHALLLVAGVGAALLVDLLACGFRRVPLAGLPLLAVYTAPLSLLLDATPWWGFVAGALAFLLLIAVDQSHRLARWGRVVAPRSAVYDSQERTVSTTAVRTSALKIGGAATGLALLVPLVVPTFGNAVLTGFGTGPGGDGDAVAISNPMVDLKRDLTRGEDVDLLWLTTTDRDPSYLRISVLDVWDGTTWKPSKREIPVEQRADGELPAPPGLGSDVASRREEYRLRVGSDFDSVWLPAPYPVASLVAEGDWRYDLDTFDFISAGDGQTARDLSYRLEALEVRPTAAQLADADPTGQRIFGDNTELPDDLPDLVHDLAREVTEDHRTRFEKAVALQRWFREDGGFTYTTDRPAGNGTDDLLQFLDTGPDGRQGYCEQFAAAMAVMARSIGLPARVAVGFLRPQPLGEDTYVYSAHDLHAWPELYFEGAGWVRFEPTPQDRATGVPGYTAQALPAATPDDAPANNPNQNPNRFDEETAAPSPLEDDDDAAAGPRDRGGRVLLALVLLVAAVVAPRTVRTLVRRRRRAVAAPAAAAEAAWEELRDSAVDLGISWEGAVTLRTRARALVPHLGGAPSEPDAGRATEALQRLVTGLERARYARAPHHAGDAGVAGGAGGDGLARQVRADADTVVSALRGQVSRGRRLRADWLPESLAWHVRAALRDRRPRAGRGLVESGVDRAV